MRYLLDTHAFLWLVVNDPKLSARAAAIIRDPSNDLLFSAASAWQIAIKTAAGKLTLRTADLPAFLADQLARNALEALPVTVPHAAHVASLPPHHRDPFDRLLVAQAQAEGFTLLSSDPQLRQYGVPVEW